ncbi:hypothetical protein BD324DRAFT_641785 [Kockovaella imperatae]|uniref:C2H2-type domain-containing protein n=1 Tax=Kockovaella imperatae TaxID=4999 RepID=A0A1Y1UHY1_9TREE|nr:hypothetical protein BD324DRAFT_641785 [Kockovaella imperatae]ORX37599.1 hypothetical protein BD324DRAFT_641785 [Kockovaella imperatae]
MQDQIEDPGVAAASSASSANTQGSHATPPKAQLLKRVLSGGSSGSASASTPREAMGTPTSSQIPLSPGSVGNRTPKAKKTPLMPENGGPEVSIPNDGKILPLVTDMDGLQVQSPIQTHAPLPSGKSRPPPSVHTRAGSSSTDSSSTGNHPYPPSHLGSSYGSEGFPTIHMDDVQMSADTARRIAFTDEAVKSINGTNTVYQGHLPPAPNPYAMPRTFANFVKPQSRHDRTSDVSRQSSTSSTTTEASTSSEESDLCVPTLEWVTTSNKNLMPRMVSPVVRTASPGQMPPPSIHSRSSPRKSSNSYAHATPKTIPTTLSDIPSSSDQDDEDDTATVGHGRDRSPSASSLSAESGLDLLWKAAASQGGTPTDSPESRGKRKAGAAEAVAQWRNSGIPNGPEVKPEPSSSGPPKKRRRSEIAMEKKIDPALMAPVDEPFPETIDDDSDSERPASENDSEYGNKGRSRVGRGGRVSTGTAASTGGAGKGGSGGKKSKKVGDSPGGGGGGGNGSGAGGGSGRRGSNAGAVAGVQCEYVNPLPPYNRCSDVFTRKYDLPRHMARHARREGELVMEGKLSEDKAILWNTIKDKPKVTCNQCGESFTRMDALKRHQAKQHHHQ